MKKKHIIILAAVLILLPVVLYAAIVVTNNCIAAQIEKVLKLSPLPPDTVLVDSISLAGKLTGNGNGMQYMGSILLMTDLQEEELAEHYSRSFDYITVKKQTSEAIDFIHPKKYSFEGFTEESGRTYYSITCWDSNRRDLFSDFVITLLDFDIRGY